MVEPKFFHTPMQYVSCWALIIENIHILALIPTVGFPELADSCQLTTRQVLSARKTKRALMRPGAR
jgi:hypothetical protein